MTGPEHFREAEQLLDVAKEFRAQDNHPDAIAYVSMAATHAQLALVAATAYPAERDYLGDESTSPREWTAVIS